MKGVVLAHLLAALARRVAGERAYALTGDLVLLERAVRSYALDLLTAKGFTPISVPALVKEAPRKTMSWRRPSNSALMARMVARHGAAPTLDDYRRAYAGFGAEWPGDDEIRRRHIVAPDTAA